MSGARALAIFFPERGESFIHEPDRLFRDVREALLSPALTGFPIREATSAEEADCCVIRERSSYKGADYPRNLASDHLTGPWLHKIITINTEDGPTGLLRGLYTSLSSSRFDRRLHRAIPYRVPEPGLPSMPVPKRHLASWRGNLRSNAVRSELLSRFQHYPGFRLETTESWFDHALSEKTHYAELMRSSSFSLCPAGWAHATVRIYESMSHGVAPVIVADGFVPPSGPDWGKATLFIPIKSLRKLPEIINQARDQAALMGECALTQWRAFFAPGVIAGYYANAILDLVHSECFNSDRDSEVRRINGMALRWKNGWTLPQRIVSGIRRKAFPKTNREHPFS